MLRLFWFLVLALSCPAADEFLPNAKRVLFLGDSITYAGHYVEDVELYLAVHEPDREITVINCGLPSETVSGLSEAGHADGKFPRPDLHERLDRVLELVKPDLVFACYGMNCGIYLPFDEARFAKYRDGIEKLHAKVKAAGADIIHLTPAVFDPVPIRQRLVAPDQAQDGKMSADYDSVLGRYAAWLVEQGSSKGWRVIDVHTAMSKALGNARQQDPTFTFAKDGVHPNESGHHVIAAAIFRAFGVSFDPDSTAHLPLLRKIRTRSRILADAYLTAAGHRRPGMKKGVPLSEASAQAAEITASLRTAPR